MSCVTRPGAQLGFSGLVWKCVLPGDQLLRRIVIIRVSEDEELQNFLVVQQGAT